MEGLAKHNGPVRKPNWALQEIDGEFPLELEQYASLEAQIAAISDDIAYDNHDIDDGIRAGLLTIDQLCDLPFVEQRWRAICGRYPGARHEALLRELIREQIGLMVNDVIETTRRVSLRREYKLRKMSVPPGAPLAVFRMSWPGANGSSNPSCMLTFITIRRRSAQPNARRRWFRIYSMPIAAILNSCRRNGAIACLTISPNGRGISGISLQA